MLYFIHYFYLCQIEQYFKENRLYFSLMMNFLIIGYFQLMVTIENDFICLSLVLTVIIQIINTCCVYHE